MTETKADYTAITGTPTEAHDATLDPMVGSIGDMGVTTAEQQRAKWLLGWGYEEPPETAAEYEKLMFRGAMVYVKLEQCARLLARVVMEPLAPERARAVMMAREMGLIEDGK